MEITHITAFDLPRAWYRVIQACHQKGYVRPVFRGARQGAKRRELDYLIIEITNPSNRPLVPDVPVGVPPPTSMNYVNRYLRYLMTPFKEDWEDYTYGERIAGTLDINIHPSMIEIDRLEGERVSSTEINQLEEIEKFLKDTPETNRSVIAVGKAEDFRLKHPPCMRIMQFKVRYDMLHLSVYFRSWDTWGGFPSNLAALQLMKEDLAKQIGVKDGTIIAVSMGAHLYNTEWDLAEKVFTRESQRRKQT